MPNTYQIVKLPKYVKKRYAVRRDDGIIVASSPTREGARITRDIFEGKRLPESRRRVSA